MHSIWEELQDYSIESLLIVLIQEIRLLSEKLEPEIIISEQVAP